MAYPIECVKYLNLPTIPKDVIDSIIPSESDLSEAKERHYISTHSNVEKLNEWGRENIAERIYLNYQILYNDLPAHIDRNTKSKLLYIVETGGDNVYTNFYTDEDKTELIYSAIIEPNRWCLFEADVAHEITGMDKDKRRIGITGQIFRDFLPSTRPQPLTGLYDRE